MRVRFGRTRRDSNFACPGAPGSQERPVNPGSIRILAGETDDGDGHPQGGRILLDQHAHGAAEQAAVLERVLGWTYVEMPGIGYGMQVGGHNIGGLFDLDGPNTPPGTVPMIGVMVKVETPTPPVKR